MTSLQHSNALPSVVRPPPANVNAAERSVVLDAAMSRYADGDDGAFAEIFRGLSPRLHAFLQRLSGSRSLADDLVQETFLRLHRARGSFARGRAVTPWAYAIARNCYLDFVRSSEAKVTRCGVSSDIDLPGGMATSAEASAMAMQAAHAVERALAGMTVARREAFVLLRYEGLSVASAAKILGISEGALKLRAFQAYEILRSALREMESVPPSDKVCSTP